MSDTPDKPDDVKAEPGAAPDAAPFVPPGAKCPICRKPTELKYRPFCSKRCADVDLSRWFTGAYAIPAVESEEPDEEEGGF